MLLAADPVPRLPAAASAVATPALAVDAVATILDLARWAPSGDNAQAWRFRRLGGDQVRIDTRDQSRDCLYERDGRCGLVSIGALLETIRLAATTVGRRALIAPLAGGNANAPSFAVTFRPEPGLTADPLAAWIRARSVHRGTYAGSAPTAAERTALEQAAGSEFRLRWATGAARLRWAGLNQRAALLRLDTKVGWELMGRIIEWDARFSADRLPDRALGLPPALLGTARRQLASWGSTRFANRWLAGTWAPRLLLEWWPGLRCGAHLALQAATPDDSAAGWLRAGAAVQRLWLAATALGLRHQPGLSPLVFARYARDGIAIDTDPRAQPRAEALGRELRALLGADALERTVWLGRIGRAPPAPARSLRLALATLCTPPPELP
ncbi:MAG: molybdopterin biosynthesis protein MoeY [Planctomycetes bacterium]|nr:molybdopterin biosynthesis protein MoeY [Planctomycetota bacterium]